MDWLQKQAGQCLFHAGDYCTAQYTIRLLHTNTILDEPVNTADAGLQPLELQENTCSDEYTVLA
jgi:hypothetical protein